MPNPAAPSPAARLRDARHPSPHHAPAAAPGREVRPGVLARRARRRRRVAALTLLVGAAGPTVGCYSYAPAAPSAVPEGGELRVELTAVAAETLAGQLGADVRAVDGRLRARDAERVVLAVTRTVLRSGAEQEWRGEEVAIPTSGVARVGRRTLSRGRTALVAAAVIGGSVLAALAAGSDFSLAGRGRGGGGQER